MTWKIIEGELGRPITVDADPETELKECNEGLRFLEQPLREVAVLRLERPEASLAEIGEALNPPIGKAAVSKRFAKIKGIAEKSEQE